MQWKGYMRGFSGSQEEWARMRVWWGNGRQELKWKVESYKMTKKTQLSFIMQVNQLNQTGLEARHWPGFLGFFTTITWPTPHVHLEQESEASVIACPSRMSKTCNNRSRFYTTHNLAEFGLSVSAHYRERNASCEIGMFPICPPIQRLWKCVFYFRPTSLLLGIWLIKTSIIKTFVGKYVA